MDYQFYNNNPLGLVEEDCVTRAISLALDEDYYKIKKQLYLVAELFECEALCVCCYEHLLESVYQLEEVPNCKGMSIREFANKNYKGIYIIRVDGHLTCVIDSILYDIWNCRDEIVDIAWKVKEKF